MIAESIKGDRIILLEFNSIKDTPVKGVKELGVSDAEFCAKREAPGICTFPKSELSRFTEIYQWDLDWADFTIRPDREMLGKISIRVFDNTLPKYIKLFEAVGSTVLFSSHDNESAYMCVKDKGIAERFLRHLLTAFLKENNAAEQAALVGNDLIEELLRRSANGIIIHRHDVDCREDQITFTCWQDSDKKVLKASDVVVTPDTFTATEWEDRPRPKHLRRTGCLPFVIGIVLLVAGIVVACKMLF